MNADLHDAPGLDPEWECEVDDHVWRVVAETDRDTLHRCLICGEEAVT